MLVELEDVIDWLSENLDRFMGNVWIIPDLLDELRESIGYSYWQLVEKR
jgi:hypothetical protein